MSRTDRRIDAMNGVGHQPARGILIFNQEESNKNGYDDGEVVEIRSQELLEPR